MEEHKFKQRLPQWLREKTDSQEIPGVRWVDEAKNIVRLPWKHRSRGDWQESDGLLVKLWAINSGKSSDNEVKNKCRFRNALNKHKYIKLLKTEKAPDGNVYRDYELLNELNASSSYELPPKLRALAPITAALEQTPESRYPMNIPTVVQELSSSASDEPGEGMLQNCEDMPMPASPEKQQESDSFSFGELMKFLPSSEDSLVSHFTHGEGQDVSMPSLDSVGNTTFQLEVFYLEKRILEKTLTKNLTLRFLDEGEVSSVEDTIILRHPSDYNMGVTYRKELLQIYTKILRDASDGVRFTLSDGALYVERKCAMIVGYFDVQRNAPYELPRKEVICILQKPQKERCDTEVCLVVGQSWEADLSKKLCTIHLRIAGATPC